MPQIKKKSIIILLFWGIGVFAGDGHKVLIEYFFQIGCKQCENVNAFVVPRLKNEFANQYELRKYDTAQEENFIKLAEYQEKLNINDNEPVCMILDHRIYLGGYKKIESEIFNRLQKLNITQNSSQITAIVDNPQEENNAKSILVRRGKSFTVAAVIVAGLIDGINPCVFSTLVFFLSLLSISKIKGLKLLMTGGTYCFACFLTYLALGFGVLRFLKLFSGYSAMQKGLDIFMIAVLAIFAVLSFADAWRFRRSGAVDSVKLQLPEKLKLRIHAIMRRGLKYFFLLPGAFFIGLLVTVLESVCTGQVYVPTLVLLSKETGGASKWLVLLLLYNVMFIVPLLILFFAAYKGMNTPGLIEWSKKNVVVSKMLMGLFFIAMGLSLWLIN